MSNYLALQKICQVVRDLGFPMVRLIPTVLGSIPKRQSQSSKRMNVFDCFPLLECTMFTHGPPSLGSTLRILGSDIKQDGESRETSSRCATQTLAPPIWEGRNCSPSLPPPLMLETLILFYLAPNNNLLSKNRSLQVRENPTLPTQVRKRLSPCSLWWLILTCLHLAAWEISEPHLWVCLCFRKKFTKEEQHPLDVGKGRWSLGLRIMTALKWEKKAAMFRHSLRSLFIMLCAAQNHTCHQLWWTKMSEAISQNKSLLLLNCSWQVSVTETKITETLGLRIRTASWKQNVLPSKPANFFVLNPLSYEADCIHIH